MISTEPWYVDPYVHGKLLKNPPKNKQYVLQEGGKSDCEKVVALYKLSPVAGYFVSKVEVIHNPALTRQFEGKVMVLNARANSTAFAPKWNTEQNLSVRNRIDQSLKKITIQCPSSKCKHVQLFPAFHGTRAPLLDSIFQTGFANLATTDSGFFGKGIYNTKYAEYAHRVYSDGTLIFNWIAFYSAYPVTLPDMHTLQGGANHSNYDAHYTLVVPKNPNNPNEVVYYPITEFQNPTYDELVVFDSAHVLPRYLVTFAPEGLNLKPLLNSATGLSLLRAITLYFQEAPTSLQPFLQQQMTTLTNQLTTPLDSSQLSLLTLIERSRGEQDPNIKLTLAGRINKVLGGESSHIFRSEKHSSEITSVNQSLQKAEATNLLNLKNVFNLQGHTHNVTVLRKLSNGNFVSGSWDRTVRIWNPKLGTCLTTFPELPGEIQAIVEFSDGTIASACGCDWGIKLWNPKTGKLIQALEGGSETAVKCLKILENGNLVSGDWDGIIKIWDPKKGVCLRTLKGHQDTITALEQLSDGILASGSRDYAIKLWNPQQGTCLRTLKGHADNITVLKQLSNGILATGSEDGKIKFWDSKNGNCIRTLKCGTGYVYDLLQLSNGTLASASWEIKIWDPKSGECLRTLEGHTKPIWCIKQFKNGILASGSLDSTVKLWDVNSGTCLNTLEHNKDVRLIELLSDDTLVSVSEDHIIRLWK